MLNRTMTLGELISALERKEETEEIRFDFVYFRPSGTIHSYRGDYSQLAIGYTNEYTKEKITVGIMLAVLRDAAGKEFTGWKGGEYTMDDDTPIWVGNPDEAGGTGIVDIRDGLYVTIITAHFDN